MFESQRHKKYIFAFICIIVSNFATAVGLFEFTKAPQQLSTEDKAFINSITSEQWIKSTNFGTESVERKKRLENILLNAQISIRNGSLSHSQLLDTLPNEQAQRDSEIALKILKSSLHVYHTLCLENNLNAERCRRILEFVELPSETPLARKCDEITQSRREGHHAFRRLLPRFYKDAFYELYTERANLPPPRLISAIAQHDNNLRINLEEESKNLALVQWAQFIEHDLSKPVVTSMANGEPIECCNKDNYNLQPRYRHTACAPLLIKNGSNPVSCLNYVRSALAVGDSCTFGAAEQLNQATGYFDLSQLYGFTNNAEQRMRAYKDGRIKCTQLGSKLNRELLPMATVDSHDFCAFNKRNSSDAAFCFMAGDSRVNSNPFAITIYTIFLRNHNRIALALKKQHANWDDEQLYQTAKAINVDTYRQIVFKEWLPEVLGRDLATKINAEIFSLDKNNDDHKAFHISNEFAVAAIRFYYSMLPDALNDLAAINKNDEDFQSRQVNNNDILPHALIFALRDQWYTPKLMYSSRKIDQILESLLQQRAMKMDATYVSSLIPDAMGNMRPTHANILAFDIQRGRDHGLQPYYKYLEICNNVKIKEWRDLEAFISKEDIFELRSVYGNWTDIDLIIGGIAEMAKGDSTVGPTFACILGEQFAKIRQWQHLMGSSEYGAGYVDEFNRISAADLICANSDLKEITQNIFHLPSKNNPISSCAERTEVQN